jgi:hypothetical protein
MFSRLFALGDAGLARHLPKASLRSRLAVATKHAQEGREICLWSHLRY